MSKIVVLAVGVAVVALFLTQSFRSDPSPVVNIKDGKLQGRIAYSRDGKQYFEYLSIPYAEPPINNLRFEPPVPLKQPWTGIKQATSNPPFCIQADAMLRGKLYGVENCLFLNTYTHSLEGKRPVIVYIHGGGFQNGAAHMYHPKFFMDEDIVLVTMNYRLGPFGFLNLEDGAINGNMGLKDQTLALKWVQENIGKFGGDATKVTLMGESAGAGSVEYHMLSPASKGLFQRAILQSGAVTCPWAFRNNPKEVANRLIKHTKCDHKEGHQLVECLKQLDALDLVRPLLSQLNPLHPEIFFAPSVETVVKGDTFLAENPRTLLKSGKLVNKVPAIIGFTSGEGALRTARIDAIPEAMPEIDKNWETLAARLLIFDDADLSSETARKLRNKYFGSASFTDNLHEFKKNFSLMASDVIFFGPIQKAAMLHAKYGAPIYLYYYDYDLSTLPSVYSLLRAVRSDDWIFADAKLAYASFVDLIKKWFKWEGPHEFGTTHGDDLLMLWNMEGWTAHFTGPDTKFSKAFVKSFVDFAKNSEPLKFDGVAWPAVQKETTESPPKYMFINTQPKVIAEPVTERLRFWKSLKLKE